MCRFSIKSTLAVAMAGVCVLANGQSASTSDSLAAINRSLKLTPAQVVTIDPIFTSYLKELGEAATHHPLTQEERDKIRQIKKNLGNEVRGNLEKSQYRRVNSVLDRLRSDGKLEPQYFSRPSISLTYEVFLPSGAEARSIFGQSPSAFQFGLIDVESSPKSRWFYNIGLQGFNVFSSNGYVDVFTPELFAGYELPLFDNFSAYGLIDGGPSYFDYSFNNPNGNHFGAKRLGGEADLEVGLRFGRLQASARYVALTQPSGIDLNGFQFGITCVLIRF